MAAQPIRSVPAAEVELAASQEPQAPVVVVPVVYQEAMAPMVASGMPRTARVVPLAAPAAMARLLRTVVPAGFMVRAAGVRLAAAAHAISAARAPRASS
jgi:hypothetical protein